MGGGRYLRTLEGAIALTSNAVRAGGSRAMRGGRLYFLWFCTQRPPPFAQTYYSRYARAHTLISHNHTHISLFLFSYTHSFDHHIFWQKWEGLTQRFSLLFRITISFTFFCCQFVLNPDQSWIGIYLGFIVMLGEGGTKLGEFGIIFFAQLVACFTIGADHQPVRSHTRLLST